jgi:hypothetical protein
MSGRFHRALALGVAIAAISCSDPVPPAYKAGVRVNVTSLSGCPASATTRGVGNPPPEAAGTAGKGGPIFDGEEGVKATCSVKGGPPFNVSTSVSGNFMSFNLTGSLPASGPGTATIGVSMPELASKFFSSSACTLTAIQTSQGVQVKPGAMWASFNCPMVTGEIASEVCRLQGEVVIENCD